MKKVVLSDVAFNLLDRIQFLMSLMGRRLSKSEALVIFCKEVDRATPSDSLLQTGFPEKTGDPEACWIDFVEHYSK